MSHKHSHEHHVHNHSGQCNCSQPAPMSQSLDELEFERGLWGAARDGNDERVEQLLPPKSNLFYAISITQVSSSTAFAAIYNII